MADDTQQAAESRELEYLFRTGKARYYRGYVIEWLDNGRFLALHKGYDTLFDAETVIDKLFDDSAYEHDEADEICSVDENDEHRLRKWELV
jgi:hypothetical protein